MRMFRPVFILLVCTACVGAQGSRSVPVKTCSQISLARPGLGASYRGTLRIDDYKLAFTIPQGLTGWGADPVAPFHGFTIFLASDDDRSSCIIFEIYLRVEPGQTGTRRHGVKTMIGDVPAWKENATGAINGTELTNVTVRFSYAHDREVDDGTVRLVTPTKDISRAPYSRRSSRRFGLLANSPLPICEGAPRTSHWRREVNLEALLSTSVCWPSNSLLLSDFHARSFTSLPVSWDNVNGG